MPEADFLIAGPIGYGISGHNIDGRDFPNNVSFPGLVDRPDVPAFLARLDVGIIPYLINEYTSGVFPMKVFEYLAAGLPVVATELPSLVGQVREVSFARTPEAFVESLRSALRDGDERARRRRTTYAQAHSWEHRIEEAACLLRRFAPSSDVTPPASMTSFTRYETQDA
jgi:glycosyltransferase involved in cell wall biosynthesis